MNSYFFKMTQAEKNNILDQHKTVYDGYATQYGQNNQQPLYVQDLANDKGGITVNNRGDVKSYTNMNINEMYYSVDAETAPEVSFDFGGPDSMAVNMEEQMDMIGDGSDDLDHGTFEDDEMEMLVSPEGEMEIFVDDEDDYDTMRGRFFKDEDMESEWDEPRFDEIDLSKSDDIDMDQMESLEEQVNKTLDMFRRIINR
jgi:hypothetical protein